MENLVAELVRTLGLVVWEVCAAGHGALDTREVSMREEETLVGGPKPCAAVD